MADDGFDPTSFKEILARASSPADLAVLFIVGPVAWVFWVFFGIAALPAGTFAALVAVFALGIKKWIIDARRQKRKASLPARERWRRYLDLVQKDSQMGRMPELEAADLRTDAEQFDLLVERRLVNDEQVHDFIDQGLTKRMEIGRPASRPEISETSGETPRLTP